MLRFWLSTAAFFFGLVPGWGQSPATDSQNLQALLTEVRQLRRDLQTVAIVSQRSHILIFHLQVAETAVRYAQDRADTFRNELERVQTDRKRQAEEIKRVEEAKDSSDTPAAQQKELESALLDMKAKYDSTEEQDLQTKLNEAEEQLRTEQAKLNVLEDQLSALEKSLESLDPGTQ
jgi:chromosome segregation ATPase